MNNPTVYVLSDSVGETAELVIKAGLSQFTNGNYKIQRVPYVEDTMTIDETLELVKEESGIIGYTLVDPNLRRYMSKEAAEMGVEAIDIMGPMMDAMERTFNHEPRHEPGLVYKLDQDYFKRIEAIEFAVRYDDGRHPRGIARSDVVLRISTHKLNEIRKERLKALGLGDHAAYATFQRIEEELQYFDELIEKIGCEVIDVSHKAVEETANIILQMIETKNN